MVIKEHGWGNWRSLSLAIEETDITEDMIVNNRDMTKYKRYFLLSLKGKDAEVFLRWYTKQVFIFVNDAAAALVNAYGNGKIRKSFNLRQY